MDEFNVDQHNMSYLQLDEEQYRQHCELMRKIMSEWPPELYQYCVGQSKVYGFSGDGLAVWVADWIRNRPGPRIQLF